MTVSDFNVCPERNVELYWHNENTFSLAFRASPSLALTALIADIQQRIIQQFSKFILDTVPAYNTLMVVVDVTLALPDDFAEKIMQQLTVDAQLVKRDASPATDEGQPASRSEGYAGALLTIPVWYHSDVAPDLQALADGAGLSVKQVISLHTQTSYTVCALGFAPGFPYLGFVDARLAKPRLATPRHSVAAGSIGIADNQTGIYPSASPGGWNIIGRTPLKCFDVNRPVARASLFAVGQTVRFESVSREQYEALRSDAGLYLSATCADKERQ